MIAKEPYTERIKALLMQKPKGLTISQIARELDVNRNTIARYLENLSVSGQIEMRAIGAAKLVFLSNRIPLREIISVCKMSMFVLDSNLVIQIANIPSSIEFGLSEDELVGMRIDEVISPAENILDFQNKILLAVEGTTTLFQVDIEKDGAMVHISGRVLPTILENGDIGAVVLLDELGDLAFAERNRQDIFRALEMLVHNANIPVCIVDIESGEIIHSNDLAQRMDNCTPGDSCPQVLDGELNPCASQCEKSISCGKTPVDENGITHITCQKNGVNYEMQDIILHWKNSHLCRLRIAFQVE